MRTDSYVCENVIAQANFIVDVKRWHGLRRRAVFYVKLKERPECCPQQAVWIKIIRLRDKDREAAPSFEALPEPKGPPYYIVACSQHLSMTPAPRTTVTSHKSRNTSPLLPVTVLNLPIGTTIPQ